MRDDTKQQSGPQAPDHDILILGAGAAGMLCGLTAARRGRDVVLMDQGAEPGRKLRASGGGRCNCTNKNATPERYLTRNPRFTTQALSRYAPADFLNLLRELRLSAHEEGEGQMFCDQGAARLADALENACREAGCRFLLGRSAVGVVPPGEDCGLFRVETRPPGTPSHAGPITARRLVIALGSPAWPALGGSDSVARLAGQLGLPHIPAKPALCPLVLTGAEADLCRELAGVSITATASCAGASFTGGLLFTHQGLSGPAALNASSHWRRGEAVRIDLAPGADLGARLRDPANGKSLARTVLAGVLPRRLAEILLDGLPGPLRTAAERKCAELSRQQLEALSAAAHDWRVSPKGTAGMARAEAASGGLDTAAFSPKTMQCRDITGLFAIGEALDVAGELGGFNLHWAWASAVAAGMAL
jgi:predicted Rossmann fold flavoprotein